MSHLKLNHLLDSLQLEQTSLGNSSQNKTLENIEVTSLCSDSRRLEANCVFVAIRGEKADGHDFLSAAEAKGAVALIVEDISKVPKTFSGVVVKVSSTRDALNKLAARFYGDPGAHLFNIGVTGTNGKTTTTYMTEAIFARGAMPAGVIGTINHHFGVQVWKTEMTTPDPMSFQHRLREFVDLGAKAVAIEVSSHALRQSRVDEVPFDVAIFTNLTRDHLDYHGDMEDYFDAKSKLFTDLLSRSPKARRVAIVNAEDEYGKRIVAKMGGSISPRRAGLFQSTKGVQVWTYGSTPDATLRFGVLAQGFTGTRFRLKTPFGSQEFLISMPGLHNVFNACGAIGAALAAGISLKTSAQALADFGGVPGRLESVPNKSGVNVFVDYAHTDDAIATVLHYLTKIRSETGLRSRIITVFGCGGDRDRGKRPLMMKAAEAASDFVVVTSDNPRTEDAEAIIKDILLGARTGSVGNTVFKETDRRCGIAKALSLAQTGDVVLIAGKGHEEYQQIGATKFPFSDVSVVKEILA